MNDVHDKTRYTPTGIVHEAALRVHFGAPRNDAHSRVNNSISNLKFDSVVER